MDPRETCVEAGHHKGDGLTLCFMRTLLSCLPQHQNSGQNTAKGTGQASCVPGKQVICAHKGILELRGRMHALSKMILKFDRIGLGKKNDKTVLQRLFSHLESMWSWPQPPFILKTRACNLYLDIYTCLG